MKSPMHYARLIALLLAGLSVGLHWGLVQTLGWVSMTIEFSRSTSLKEALEMTFDGEHPCHLCKLAQKQGPLSERDAPAPSVSKSNIKPLFATLWADPILVLVSHPLTVFWPVMSERAARLDMRPALRPPRVVA